MIQNRNLCKMWSFSIRQVGDQPTPEFCKNTFLKQYFSIRLTPVSQNKGSSIGLGFVFSILGGFLDLLFLRAFRAILQHFGAGNCHFHRLCNILELEPLIFRTMQQFGPICNILELEAAVSRVLQHF